MALGTRKVTRIVRETCDPMECTLGILEISWFAEFQIASGAISNLQSRAHLREGTPATLNQRVQGTPVQFSGVCLHLVTFLVWRAGCTPALSLLEFFCDRIFQRSFFPPCTEGFAEERAWRKRPVGSWGR